MSGSITDRMIRAAKLDPNLYEEVEADQSALGQAMTIVVIASVGAGIGTASAGIGALIVGAIAALVGWYVWAFLTYFIGTKLLAEPTTDADLGQLLRTTGFSASPGILRAAAIVPGIGGILALLVSIWMLAAMVVAVRQALDYTSTGRALGVCAIGWLVQIVVMLVAGLILVGLGVVEVPEGAVGG